MLLAYSAFRKDCVMSLESSLGTGDPLTFWWHFSWLCLLIWHSLIPSFFFHSASHCFSTCWISFRTSNTAGEAEVSYWNSGSAVFICLYIRRSGSWSSRYSGPWFDQLCHSCLDCAQIYFVLSLQASFRREICR